MVGDHADGPPVDPYEAGDDVASPARRDLQESAAVGQAPDHLAHVVHAPLLGRDDLLGVARWRGSRRHDRRRQVPMAGQVAKQLARQVDRVDLVRGDEVADAVSLVDAAAAELRGRDVLAQRLANDGGPRQEHARLLSHHDPVGERRRIRAATRRQTGQHRDLGHAARQADDPAEDPAVATERADALLHPGAAGGHEPDDRRAGAVGELHNAHDRVCVGLAERAAGEARVLRVAEHGAAVDQPGAAEDAVPGAGLLAHREGDHLGADHVDRARIAQPLEPLKRRERRVGPFCEGQAAHALPQSTTVAPHVNPAPNAPSSTRSPAASRPSRSLNASASGSVAADVLP